MNAYIDASVVLRVILDQPGPLKDWKEIDRAISSRLLGVECLRAVDRLRLLADSNELRLAQRRGSLLDVLARIDVVPLDERVLDRAGEPFPMGLGTLDAIHLASALAAREGVENLVFATHDRSLGTAALAMGFTVIGMAVPG